MKFLTSYYRQQGESTSVLLQQCCCAGTEILFACACGGGDKRAGSDAEILTGALLEWFRSRRLDRAVRAPEDFMDRQRKELERVLQRKTMLNASGCAGFFCLGKEFLSFCGGDAAVRAFNRQMGKTQISRLFSELETREDERGRTEAFRVLRGSIEPEVGVLLATASMLRAVSERALQESLSVGELRTEERMSKHLWELGRAGERAGGRNMAAVLLRSSAGGGADISETEGRKTAGNYIWRVKETGSVGAGSVLRGLEREKYVVRHICQETEEADTRERAELALHGYRQERLLGKGSSSQVYLVSDASGAHYACKVSRKLSLLEGEAVILRQLNHPLFPEFREYWQEQEGYLVMEYVAGQSLEEHLRRRGGFSVRKTLQVGLELSFGLLYLHEEMGLVYRDIKPANVILGQDGRARLVDMGCAWQIGKAPQIRAGTPGFAAPEQLRGGQLTAACDVYGLGKLLEATWGAGRRERRSAAGRLQRLIVACTGENVEVRLGEMRSVIRVLSQAAEGRPGQPGGWEEEILRGRLRVRKNIWKSSDKNS